MVPMVEKCAKLRFGLFGPWSSEPMFDTSHFGRFCMSNCRRSYHLFDRRYTVSYVVIVDWKQKLKRHLLLKDPTIMCGVCNVLFPNHIENSVVYFLNVYINVPIYVCMYVWMDGWMYGWMDVWMDGWM